MKLKSSEIHQNEKMPSEYTCDGSGINPPLDISEVPPNAKSLVLLMDDPDVPESVRKDRMFDHWVVYDMPPTTRHIAQNSTPPGVQGKNTSGSIGYYGPCPPDREHRYFFKLYALNVMLRLPPGATKKEVEHAMEGHVLDSTQLMGRYEREAQD